MTVLTKKYNNPFALIQVKPDNWKGLIGKTSGNFLMFSSALYGVRAGFINLENAYIKRGLKTIAQIFPIYAPKGHGDNEPERYIKYVSDATGFSRNKVLNFGNLQEVGRAIITLEAGNFWVSEKDFYDGYLLAGQQLGYIGDTVILPKEDNEASKKKKIS